MTGPLRVRRESDRPGAALRLIRRGRSGAGTMRRALSGRPQAFSIDVRLSRNTTFEIVLGSDVLRFERGTEATATLIDSDDEATELPQRPGWRGRGWHHVTVTGSSRPVVTVDGVEVPASARARRSVVLRILEGDASVAALVATPQQDARALLLHRLAELAAQVPRRRFPVGVGADGLLRFSNEWTSGFWPGSLWLASDMTRPSRLFARWARQATLDHLGREDMDVHDLGFMYEHSSLYAHRRLCPARQRRTSLCRRLRASALEAAANLLAIARTNPVAGTLPTSSPARPCRDCGPDEADTIVDSMMNLSLLVWAGRERDDARYVQAAARSGEGVARHLVRDDGSTAQSVHFRRSDGAVIRVHTHQGFADDSTWARGQAWGLYGFTQTAAGIPSRRRQFLEVAERLAAYVEEHLPAGGVPLYDYEAPAGSPIDTSAGVITAAGLYRLADICAREGSGCTASRRWERLADRMLAASLREVSRRPPIGFLGSQVYSLGGNATWDDSGEFIFGVDFGLEAVKSSLAR